MDSYICNSQIKRLLSTDTFSAQSKAKRQKECLITETENVADAVHFVDESLNIKHEIKEEETFDENEISLEGESTDVNVSTDTSSTHLKTNMMIKQEKEEIFDGDEIIPGGERGVRISNNCDCTIQNMEEETPLELTNSLDVKNDSGNMIHSNEENFATSSISGDDVQGLSNMDAINSVSNVKKAYKDEDKLRIKKAGRPTPMIDFDKRGCRLLERYEKIPWICGCLETKAFYCFPCLMFPQKLKTQWNTTGFTDMANLTKSAKSHECNKNHLASLCALSLLGKVRISKALSTAAQQRTQYNAEVKRNREFLEHHIRTTIFLATQGIAFRGHDESKDSFNRGNYVKLLENFQYYSGNKRLADCLYESSRPTFSGLSGDIQNDLIQCLYEELIEAIKAEVGKSPYVSLMANESTDIANVAQLALCIRYTDQGVTRERLVDLVDASKEKSATEMSTAIKDSFKQVIAEDAKVIGQSYDGAANNSVQPRIQDNWPYAKFVHCYAHKLAFVVKSACNDVRHAADFFEATSSLCTFFRSSPKRGCLLDKKVTQDVKHINKHLIKIISVLEDLCDSDDAKTRCEAQGHLWQLKTWENMFLLKVFNAIFQYGDIVSKLLQSSVIDCVEADRMIGDFRNHLEGMRSDKAFQDFLTELQVLDEKIAFTPQPRVRQKNEPIMFDSGYTPSAHVEPSLETKLKQCLTSILDGLSAELDARFANLDSFKWMKMLDPKQFNSLSGDANVETLRECIRNLKTWYPFITAENSNIERQFQTLYGDSDLQDAIGDVKNITALLQKLHELDIHDALPHVTDIGSLAAATAITSVSCERFSVLRRIKNYQQNTMGQGRRTKHLMVLSVESEFTCKLAQSHCFYDKIIDRFAQKGRRIDLLFRD